MESQTEHPSFEDVFAYAQRQVDKFIRKFAFSLPEEQREDIAQSAMMRVWEAYKKLDASRGWKSYIQTHCRGAVLDFIKGGNGFIESGSVSDPEHDGLKTRVEIHSDDSDDSVLSVDETAGIFGVFDQSGIDENRIKPDWQLLSRMSGVDENLHIVSKVLLGFSQEEIADQIGTDLGTTLSRERVSQRLYEFFNKLDDPALVNDAWINQCIFALGLCSYYHMPEEDNGQGWDKMSFDLQDPMSFKLARRYYNPTLFDAVLAEGVETVH